MKVVHVVGWISGGGAEQQMRMFIESTEDKIENVIVCVKRADGLLPNSTIIRLKGSSVLERMIEMTRILREIKPEIVYCWLPAMLPVVALPARIVNIYLIAGIRSRYHPLKPVRIMQQLLYLLANKVVSNVHPDDLRWQYKAIYRMKQGAYIPNSINSHRKDHEFKSGKCVKFVFIGRLIGDKNISRLLSVWQSMPDEFRARHTLDIYGNGKKQEEVLRTTRACESIRYRGYVEGISAKLERYDALILPSVREGMPNVLFEAIAKGLNVLVSDIRVHRRWLNAESAILFDPLSEKDMKSAIHRYTVLEMDNRECMHRKALSVLDDLRQEKLITRYENIFEIH